MREGELLARRFRIERPAGAGAMGTVFRACDVPNGGRWVAVKVLPGTRVQPRFEREVAALSGIDHDAVVRYVAHGRSDAGEAFVAMEWIEGQSLADRLAVAGLTGVESMLLAQRLLLGLGALHAAGVVHRDLKPSNVMLAGGRVEAARIVDLGIARLASDGPDLTGTGTHLGTPRYMAPEQIRDPHDVDGRADVFSLGCVLFECLTGAPAFPGEESVAVLAQVLFGTTPEASERRPELPEELDPLLERLLARSRRLRPFASRELADEFGRWLQVPLRDRLALVHASPRQEASRVRSVRPALSHTLAGETAAGTHERPSFALLGSRASRAARGGRARPSAPPRPRGPWVGRSAELAEVSAILERARAVTIWGGAGVGKTRLALEVARTQGVLYPAQIAVFCELGEARDTADVVRIVSERAGLPLAARAEPELVLGGLLGKLGDVLLVLDRCEHLAAELDALVALWVENSPSLSVVATSRTRSRGLRELELLPLATRAPGLQLTAAASALSEAAELVLAFTAQAMGSSGRATGGAARSSERTASGQTVSAAGVRDRAGWEAGASAGDRGSADVVGASEHAARKAASDGDPGSADSAGTSDRGDENALVVGGARGHAGGTGDANARAVLDAFDSAKARAAGLEERSLRAARSSDREPAGPAGMSDAAGSELANDPEAREFAERIASALDGNPLAIELAAARVPVLGLAGVVARLPEQLALLADHTASQTMRGAIAWSWDLLSEPERLAFMQCSVFRGSFTLAAAEAVVVAPVDGPSAVLPLVHALREQSILMSAPLAGSSAVSVRLTLSAALREFAQAQLVSARAQYPQLVELETRHAQYYAALARSRDAAAKPSSIEPRNVERREHDNLRAAAEHMLEVGDATSAAAILFALEPAILAAGVQSPLVALLERALAAADAGRDAASATAVRDAGTATARRDDTGTVAGGAGAIAGGASADARAGGDGADARAGGAGARAGGDGTTGARDASSATGVRDGSSATGVCGVSVGSTAPADRDLIRARARLRGLHARLLAPAGELAQAQRELEQARDEAASARDPWLRGVIALDLGVVFHFGRDLDRAAECYEEALQALEDADDAVAEARCHGNLGAVAHDQGRMHEAADGYRQAIALLDGTDEPRLRANFRGNLALLEHEAGRFDAARQLYQQAAMELEESADARLLGIVLGNWGTLELQAERRELAERIPRQQTLERAAPRSKPSDRPTARTRAVDSDVARAQQAFDRVIESARSSERNAEREQTIDRGVARSAASERDVERSQSLEQPPATRDTLQGNAGSPPRANVPASRSEGAFRDAARSKAFERSVEQSRSHDEPAAVRQTFEANPELPARSKAADHRAYALFSRAQALLEGCGDRRSLGLAAARLGAVHALEGRIDDAQIALSRADRHLRRDPLGKIVAACLRGFLELARAEHAAESDDPSGAQRALAQARRQHEHAVSAEHAGRSAREQSDDLRLFGDLLAKELARAALAIQAGTQAVG